MSDKRRAKIDLSSLIGQEVICEISGGKMKSMRFITREKFPLGEIHIIPNDIRLVQGPDGVFSVPEEEERRLARIIDIKKENE